MQALAFSMMLCTCASIVASYCTRVYYIIHSSMGWQSPNLIIMLVFFFFGIAGLHFGWLKAALFMLHANFAGYGTSYVYYCRHPILRGEVLTITLSFFLS